MLNQLAMHRSITIQNASGGKEYIPLEAVDTVGAQERASFFTKRSIKNNSKMDALYLAIRMIDLTTLEGADTPGKVIQLCNKAKYPLTPILSESLSQYEKFRPIPSVAAVCVYPNLVPVAKKALEGTNINIAAVATGFPSGQFPLDIKLQDVRSAVELGANEIDMVIDRGAFLRGDYQTVYDEIVAVKEACGAAHLKVILETGELGTLDNIRLASNLAIAAGADFIKTSTGKIGEAATMPVTLVMLQCIADHYAKTGKKIGMKPAGGIRNSKQAIHYLVMLNETLGPEWLTPDLFRFGASALLNDLLKQIYKQITGRYYYDKAFSLD